MAVWAPSALIRSTTLRGAYAECFHWDRISPNFGYLHSYFGNPEHSPDLHL